MRGFKDLIARRRPTTEGGTTEDGSEDTPGHDPWAELQRATAQPPTGADRLEAQQARAARDHVPRPPRPKPLMSRKWTPNDAHLVTGTPQAVHIHSTEEQAAEHPQARPAPSRRPPQTRMILADLDPIRDDLDTDEAAPPAASAPKNERPDPDRPLSDRPADAALSGSRPKVWDMAPGDATPARSEDRASSAPDAGSALAQSAASAYRGDSQSGSRPASARAKTRLLGFHAEAAPDVLDAPQAAPATEATQFPVGWLVVTEGPGRGASFTLTAGLSTIGRDAGQTVTLDFGDSAISRERHLAIAYDTDENRAYVGHGGKANIVKLNDKPLLTTEELNDGDTIRIGKTHLKFVGFCTEGFSWGTEAGDPDA